MNAINHAATSLLIKKKYPHVPLVPILISVQLIEMLWVILNILGVERTDYAATVSSLADIHLVHMPFSHSVAFTLLWAALAGFVVARVLKKPGWALAVMIGVCSHIVLDIITHAFDIEIVPFAGLPEIGSGLYAVPVAALLFELGYAVVIWRLVDGSRFLLWALLLLNLSSLSFYLPQLKGPESLLSQHPDWFAPVIGVHILFGLLCVFLLSRYEARFAAKKVGPATEGAL
ncbi:metal-dependent hydrolase [Marinobacteraceae bacterium S3BR75-40.1]